MRAVIEVIHQGQSEVSRGTVKYEAGKGYENNLGISKWSDVYRVRRGEVFQQGQSEVSHGKVKWEGGIAYVNNPGVSKWSEV